MSVQVMSWVFNHAPDNLKPSEMLVALVLAEHANADGGLAYPTVKRMCELTRLAERTVQVALQSLIARGVIREHLVANGPRPTVYCFPTFRGAENAGVRAEDRGAESAGVVRTVTPAKNDILPPQILRKTPPTPLNEPSREPSISLAPSRGRYTAEFETFWAAYPKVLNNSKIKAANAWERLSKTQRSAALRGLGKYLASPGWRDGFAPHTSTYLNGQLWDSDPPERVAGSVGDNGRRDELTPEKLAELKQRALG